jgi:hypothetical protein
MAEQTLVSGIQYYLEDIYDYDILFMIQPMIKQTLVSEIQYYLEDIYDYDSVSFMAENETPFFLAEPVPSPTLASRIRYYLEDIYDYDDAFSVTKPVKQTADSKNISDYFAILSIFDENPFSTTELAAEQTLAFGNQYYLGDLYDYDDAFFVTQPVIKQTADSKILPDYFAVLSTSNEDLFPTTEIMAKQTIVNETPFFLTEPVPNQTLVSGIQYYLEDLYDYDKPY